MPSIELKLSRSNRTYRPSELIEGRIVTTSTSSISHQEIRVSISGAVNLQVRGGLAGMVESLYTVVKLLSIVLISDSSFQDQFPHLKYSKKIQIFRRCRRSTDFPRTMERIGESPMFPLRRISHSSPSKNGPFFLIRISTYMLEFPPESGPHVLLEVAHATQIPFSISLSNDGKTGYQRFYDTFHGGNISIQYLVTAELSRGYLQKSLSVTKEYIVECDKGFTSEQSIRANVVSFYITQDTQKHQLMPELTIGHFRVTGTIPTECAISSPLCGELIVESSAVIIRSIDILLLRVESILAGERIITEAATVQTTQIADGDVCRSLAIPIYVILPRLLVCPTLIAGPFSVEFQVSISITFESELSKLYSKSDLKTPMPWVVLETLPLRIY